LKTKITFLRHASTDNNIAHVYSGNNDLELNATGIKEAEASAEKLKNEKFDVMLYGRKKRVQKTAETVLGELVVRPGAIVVSDDIREIDFGVMEGMNYEQIEKKYPGEWKEFMNHWQNFTFPEGDNVAAFYKHCCDFVDDTINGYPGKNILVVAHKGFILACRAYLEGGGIDDFFKYDIRNAGFITIAV